MSLAARTLCFWVFDLIVESFGGEELAYIIGENGLAPMQTALYNITSDDTDDLRLIAFCKKMVELSFVFSLSNSNSGMSFFHHIAKTGKYNVLSALIDEYGPSICISINTRYLEGFAPLHFSVRYPDFEKSLARTELFLKMGTDS